MNRRLRWAAWAAGAAICLPACTEPARPADHSADSLQAPGHDGQPRLTQQELGSLVRGFADRYVAMNNQAFDAVVRVSTTSRARMVAQTRKALGAATVYAIATKPNAEVSLLDMTVQVTLEREVWTRGYALEIFGEGAKIIDECYDRLDSDIWALAGRVFTEQQLEELRDAIEKWIVDNPKQRYLAFVTVEDFAKLRESSALGKVGSPGGLSMLAPINEATRAADELRLLGERALFLAQRVPLLVEQQAELYTYTIMDKPEVGGALAGVGDLAGALRDLATEVEGLPAALKEQREALIRSADEMVARERAAVFEELRATLRDERAAIFNDLEKNTGSLRTTLTEVRETVRDAGPLTADAKAAAASLRDALTAAESLVAVFDPDGPGPKRATLPLEEARATLAELNAATRELRALLGDEGLTKHVNNLDDVAGRRIAQAGRWGLGLLAAFFALLGVYRYASLRMRRAMPPGA